MSGFVEAQAAEVAQLDDPTLARIQALEQLQRVVERHEIHPRPGRSGRDAGRFR